MSWSGDHGHGSPARPSSVGMSEDPNDILVFGYGCKLYRDDEKAEWLDKEEHLIPWMGDPFLKVDRYDGRGALMDLKPFVPPPQGFNLDEELSPEEMELEKLLDEERYMDFKEDCEFDDMDYQEVEFRKFQSDVNGVVGQSHYAAIGYSYDKSPNNSEVPIYPAPKRIDEDHPYVKPLGLIIPEDIILPPTIKLHAIIEKTAKFIASNGNQMEIILKTKQSGNSLFNFLEYRDALNPYYKFLVQAIRCGDYCPLEEDISDDQVESPLHGGECGSGSEDESGYLHPSLFKPSTIDPISTTSSIVYKPPSGPTAYSLLVSKIKGSNVDAAASQSNEADPNQQYYNSQQMNYSYSSHNAAALQQVNVGTVENETPFDPSIPQVRPSSQVPAQQDQQVIEKMASYVVKNGPAFEELARIKGDPRFIFLQPTHEFHWYYLNCKERFKAESCAVVASGNFVSYSEKSAPNTSVDKSISSSSNLTASSSVETTAATTTSLESKKKSHVVQLMTLPLSASGIPIANHASISSRPATIPPEVASRIEEIKKKNVNLFAKKDQAPTPTPSESGSVQKKEKAKIQFASSICKSIAFSLDPPSSSTPSLKEEIQNNLCDTLSENVNENDSRSNEPMDVINSECNSPNSVSSKVGDDVTSRSENGTKVPIKDDKEEREKRRKEERRRKAALFLERINSSNKGEESPVVNAISSVETLSTNNNVSEKNGKIEESLSDVESIPDPGNRESQDDLKENNIQHVSEAQDRLREDDSITLLLEIDSRGRTKQSSSRNSSRRVSRNRSRSHHRSSSSVRRSLSDSSDSDSNTRRKRSKRKHSKKTKRKRDKDRSRSSSHSKKSKRHRH